MSNTPRTDAVYAQPHRDLERENYELRAKLERAQSFIKRCADHMISGSSIAETPLPTEDEWREFLK